MKLRDEEIRGVLLGDDQNLELVCFECLVTEEGWRSKLRSDRLLLAADLEKAEEENESYFCDRCESLITG